MLKLKSQTFEIQAEPQRVLEFLALTANYALLLPSDQTSDFQANSTQFSFKAAGQVNLALEKQNLSTDRIQFIGLKSNPFAFDLIIHVLPLGSHTTGIGKKWNQTSKYADNPLFVILAYTIAICFW